MKTERSLPSCGFRYFVTEKGFGIEVRSALIPTVQALVHLVAEINSKEGFSSDITKDWGYRDVLKRVASPGLDADRVTWFATWPACPTENGLDQDPAEAVAESLFLITAALDQYARDEKIHGDILFLPIVVCIGHAMHGFPLGATFAARVRGWIRNGGDRYIPDAERMMHAAFSAMWKSEHGAWDIGEFAGYVKDGYMVHMHVPGSCPCVGSDPRAHDLHDFPIEISSHNVDGPIQQLALLAGLTELAAIIEADLQHP